MYKFLLKRPTIFICLVFMIEIVFTYMALDAYTYINKSELTLNLFNAISIFIISSYISLILVKVFFIFFNIKYLYHFLVLFKEEELLVLKKEIELKTLLDGEKNENVT